MKQFYKEIVKPLRKRMDVLVYGDDITVVFDPDKGSFEEQWFDCFERDRWEKAVNNAYKKLRTCRYIKGLERWQK